MLSVETNIGGKMGSLLENQTWEEVDKEDVEKEPIPVKGS